VSMAKSNLASAASRLARWRVWVQSAFLLAWLDPWMLRMHSVCSPVFHCYSCPLATFACPIGVLANFSALHLIPFVTLGILALVGAVFGSLVCGWACPFGFLQDLIARIPTRKFALPLWMGWSRYVVLAVFVIAIPYVWGESSVEGKPNPLFFCRLCPAGAIEAALPNTVQQSIAAGTIVWPTALKISILVLILIAMFFTWRPWCTLFCPLGAIYGLLNRVSFFFLLFQADRCLECSKCRSFCQRGGPPARVVDASHCVRCMECTNCSAVTLETFFTAPAKQAD
jgi:ferredoxin-type protein NapH